ncbi:MAG: histidine--tRNA ligase [Nanoarchaeota archaeon]
MKFQRPKGTIDYYPREQAVKNNVFSVFRRVASLFNFSEVESPAFEEWSVLCEKEGDEIKQQVFTLEQRGNERFGLRFDLTVPLTRMFVQLQKELQKPVKWSYATNMWRYERPQHGRQREFYQMGVEVFGSSSVYADAEVIGVAIETLKELGLKRSDVVVLINNRKLMQGLLEDCVSKNQVGDVFHIIDKYDKVNTDEFGKMLAFLKNPEQVLKLLEIKDMKTLEKIKKNKLAQEGFNELKAVYDLLESEFVQISLSTVRGLAYYTGTVFEIFDTKKKFRAVCGGGRYDQMVKVFGGDAVPATGMAIGYSTLLLLLEEKNLMPQIDVSPEFVIAPVDDSVKNDAWKLCVRLRRHHRVEMELAGRSLGKQLAFASGIGAKQVIVIGSRDFSKGLVTIRDMRTGKESVVKIGDLE